MSDYASLRERVYALEAGLVPECVGVPVLTGQTYVGATLSCSTGEWYCTPTAYSYAWSNGAPDAATYNTLDTDAGLTITVIVSATNANGTVAAAATNGIVIDGTPAVQAASRSAARPRADDKK